MLSHNFFTTTHLHSQKKNNRSNQSIKYTQVAELRTLFEAMNETYQQLH